MSSEILQCLASSLNPDGNVRITAELRLKQLLSSPDTALTLSHTVLSPDTDISLRQITAIILRKYVNERWSPLFPAFKGDAPSFEVKAEIRELVLRGLSDPNRKIRSACAHTLSLIANSDWPDEYPELLKHLIALISSSSLDSVHGAMQVFNEFVRSDLSEDQILPVLRELLPALLSIFGSTQHTPWTRARAVSVFRQCVYTLMMVKDQHPQAVKEATDTILPVWIDAFKSILGIPVEQDVKYSVTWDALAVRMEIFKALDTIRMSFPKSLAPYYVDLLDSSLVHLKSLLPFFTQYYLTQNAQPPASHEDEPMELSMLACPILDFIQKASRKGKVKEWFQPSNIEALIIALFGWMQMTEDDEENWGTDANAFVAHEDDDSQSYSTRVAGLDLLSVLMEREPTTTASALSHTLSAIVSESQQARSSGSTEWWRPLEAALAGLGSIEEAIMDFVEDEEAADRPKPIDIASILSNTIPQLVTLSDCPFLQGRSFVFASQYASLLPVELAGHYMSAAVDVLEAENAGVPLKVSAVKAIRNFCSGMPERVVLPMAPRIVKDIGPLLLLTSEDTLTLLLETLSAIIEVNGGEWIIADLAETLTSAMLQVWTQNNKDPLLISVLTDIFEDLAGSRHPGVYQAVVKVALPNLCDAMRGASSDDSWIASSAIELVSSLANGAPADSIGEGFFATLAPSLFQVLRDAEDRDILQNGVACLTGIVRKDVGQVRSWSDESGQSGIDNVLAVIAKLLSNEDESGGLVVGDLIIHLLRRAGSSIVSVLPELLQAMVRRMVAAKTATFVQSLVIPFAFLVQSERDTVLSLLEGIDVNGRSGLDVLIQTWSENAEVFQGLWPNRISTLGLCQLFASERPTLQHLLVKGDIIIKPETKNVIVTRSVAKKTPHEFTQIPFPVKALKLIVGDLRSSGDAGVLAPQQGKPGPESDDEDEEWQDEDGVDEALRRDELAFLSDMLGPRAGVFTDENIPDDADDEDLRSDPVSKMDMTAHLVTFLKECAARNTNGFSELVGQANAEEMLTIQRVLSQ